MKKATVEIRIFDANGGRCDCYQLASLAAAYEIGRVLFEQCNSVYKVQIYSIKEQRKVFEWL